MGGEMADGGTRRARVRTELARVSADTPEEATGLTRRVPILRLLRGYGIGSVRGDALAGITVWAVLVPQALAYASLAGAPPVAGLYTALGAMALYFVFGTSRELNMGPEGTVAILVATSVAPMAAGDEARYVALMAALAILTGAVSMLGGLLRLGWISRFLSRPILVGYIVASAVIIAWSQLGDFLGIDVDGVGSFVRNVPNTHIWTLAVGVTAIVVTLVVRRLGPRGPSYLAGMAAATLLVAAAGLADRGVDTVGAIASGLPAVGLPDVVLADVTSLVLPAAAVALLVYADSMLTARSLAKANDYEVDANQEFFAIGAANAGSGLLGGFSANGSQSRSFVGLAAGASTQVTNLVACVLVVLTLLFLTPLFERLPRAALAGVLLVAAAGLIDVQELRRVWTLSHADFWLAAMTAALVVGVGVLAGVAVAVVASLLHAALVPFRTHTAVLARIPGTSRYEDIDDVADPQFVPGLIVYRFDASLYFANADQFARDVHRLIDDAHPPAREVLLSAEAIVTIDATAHEVFHEVVDDVHERGIRFTVARAKEQFRETLERSGLAEVVDAFYLEVDEGVAAYRARTSEPHTATPSGD
jgi:sulfate permease, SulP family